MHRKAHIIPGFDEQADKTGYRNIKAIFQQQHISAQVSSIGWKQKTLSSYLKEFVRTCSGQPHCLFGFSLGAMIAVAAAGVMQPAHLVLCSLSPYFKEDLSHLTQDDQHSLGRRRVQDLNHFSFPALAAQIKSHTHIFVGSAESKVLIRRCEIAQHEIQNATLTVIPGAGHCLSDWRYRQALMKFIKTLV